MRATPGPVRLWSGAATALLLVWGAGSRHAVVSAEPARKDMHPTMKPKAATLTPSVTPAEARPGEAVVYKVKVKLDPGWHIFAHRPGPPTREDVLGILSTKFDFFDTGGLEAGGDWAAADPPQLQALPPLDGATFETHEREVTWLTILRVPPGTPTGRKTLRCQVSYQLCNARSATLPGRWTLPDVAVTVKE